MTEYNYEGIKELAKARGVSVEELFALHRSNDPFYVGKPADIQMGEWFAALWRRFGYTTGVHLRRVHYQVISQRVPVTLPITMKVAEDEHERPVFGNEYINTDECWAFLSKAGKMARYLGLVDPAAFIDKRNPEPQINTDALSAEPYIDVYDNLWSAPELPEFAEPPYFRVQNYYGRQGVLLEIWCEKSTMNDVLVPLCQRYNMNLQTGLGELSITAVLAAVRRVEQSGQPCRIGYVSDFDPAGQSMPVAVARKFEYFVRLLGIDADVRLEPIVMTAEMVERYRLPRTPIKAKEKRGAKFEERHGEGAVELDALEALHPGELGRVISRWARQYYDTGLDSEVSRSRDQLEDALETERKDVLARHDDALEALRAEYQLIRDDMSERLSVYNAKMRKLYEQIADELRQTTIGVDEYPLPQAEWADEGDDPLYDSMRDYEAQIVSYKRFQGKEVAAEYE